MYRPATVRRSSISMHQALSLAIRVATVRSSRHGICSSSERIAAYGSVTTTAPPFVPGLRWRPRDCQPGLRSCPGKHVLLLCLELFLAQSTGIACGSELVDAVELRFCLRGVRRYVDL